MSVSLQGHTWQPGSTRSDSARQTSVAGIFISIKTGLTDDAFVRTFYFCFSITLLEGQPALFGPTLEVVHHTETQISAAWLDSAKGASGEAPYK